MNNINFSKNSFTNQEPARIANKVIPNNTSGGVVSINQIRSNMRNLRSGSAKVSCSFSDGVPVVEQNQPKASVKRQTISRNEIEKMRMQALKNVGKKW